MLIRGWLGVCQPGEQGLVVEDLPDEGLVADECFFGWGLVAFAAGGLAAEGMAGCAGQETGACRPAKGFSLAKGFDGEGLTAPCAGQETAAYWPVDFALAEGFDGEGLAAEGVAACAGQETGAC